MLLSSSHSHACCLPIALLVLASCKSSSDTQAKQQVQPEEKASTTVEAPAIEAAPLPAGPIAVTRAYQVGQPYSVSLERSGSGSKMTWLGTAEVLTSSSQRTELGIHILSITGEMPGAPAQPKSVNVRIKVTIEDGSHDAEIISSDSPLAEAADLTAFEMMSGDLCQPPEGSHEQREEWEVGERSYTFAGVTTTDGLQYLAYEQTQTSDKFKSECKASIALVDGYAGQRHDTSTIDLGPDLPPSVQSHTLVVRRL